MKLTILLLLLTSALSAQQKPIRYRIKAVSPSGDTVTSNMAVIEPYIPKAIYIGDTIWIGYPYHEFSFQVWNQQGYKVVQLHSPQQGWLTKGLFPGWYVYEMKAAGNTWYGRILITHRE